MDRFVQPKKNLLTQKLKGVLAKHVEKKLKKPEVVKKLKVVETGVVVCPYSGSLFLCVSLLQAAKKYG